MCLYKNLRRMYYIGIEKKISENHLNFSADIILFVHFLIY